MRSIKSWPHILYLWLVVGLGIWFLVHTFPLLDWNRSGELLILAALIVLAEWLAVVLPQGRLACGFAVFLAAFIIYGLDTGAWVLGVATAFGQGVANRGQPLRTTLFNASRVVLAAVAAGFVYLQAGGGEHVVLWSNSLPLLLLIAIFGIINRLLAYIYLYPDRRAYPPFYWLDVIRLDIVVCLLTIPFGLLMGFFYPKIGIYGVALLFMPLLAVQLALGFYLNQTLTNRMLLVLYTVARQLGGNLEPRAMLELVLKEIYKLIPYHTGVIYLRSATRDQYHAGGVYGPQSWLLAGSILRAGDGFMGLALDDGVPQLVYDTRLDARTAGEKDLLELHSSLLLAPLVAENQVQGLLLLGDKRIGFFKEKHLQMVTTMAAQLALALVVANQVEED